MTEKFIRRLKPNDRVISSINGVGIVKSISPTGRITILAQGKEYTFNESGIRRISCWRSDSLRECTKKAMKRITKQRLKAYIRKYFRMELIIMPYSDWVKIFKILHKNKGNKK